jgi:hypothetical protein
MPPAMQMWKDGLPNSKGEEREKPIKKRHLKKNYELFVLLITEIQCSANVPAG